MNIRIAALALSLVTLSPLPTSAEEWTCIPGPPYIRCTPKGVPYIPPPLPDKHKDQELEQLNRQWGERKEKFWIIQDYYLTIVEDLVHEVWAKNVKFHEPKWQTTVRTVDMAEVQRRTPNKAEAKRYPSLIVSTYAPPLINREVTSWSCAPGPRHDVICDPNDPPHPPSLPASDTHTTSVAVVAAADATWHIQIGAYPTKKDAQNVLYAIRALTLDVLDNKDAMTVRVQKGTETLYRAWFSGFTEQAAHAACRLLARQGFGCVPSSLNPEAMKPPVTHEDAPPPETEHDPNKPFPMCEKPPWNYAEASLKEEAATSAMFASYGIRDAIKHWRPSKNPYAHPSADAGPCTWPVAYVTGPKGGSVLITQEFDNDATCHACRAILSAHFFEGGTFEFAGSHWKFAEVGAWGAVTGKIDSAVLGNGRFGLVVETSDAAQGCWGQGIEVFEFRENSVEPVLPFILTSMSSCGAEEDVSCDDIGGQWEFDRSGGLRIVFTGDLNKVRYDHEEVFYRLGAHKFSLASGKLKLEPC